MILRTNITMKIIWITLFVLVNFCGILANGQKDGKEVSQTQPESAKPTKPPGWGYIAPEDRSVLPPYFNCSKQDSDSDLAERCPSEAQCDKLGNECLRCECILDCNYGQLAEAKCTAPEAINCTGPRSFTRQYTCAFCYQTDQEDISCNDNVECDSVFDPNQGRHYSADCKVKNNVLCFGRRDFPKQIPCNWTGGHRWLTALILSITLGGFGADRFYLGHWQEGIGKLFSFGGLGVWTLVDVVMIAVRYVGPSDGSLYI